MIHTTVRLIQKRRQCQEWDSNPRLQGRLRPERSALDRSAILTAGLAGRVAARLAGTRRGASPGALGGPRAAPRQAARQAGRQAGRRPSGVGVDGVGARRPQVAPRTQPGPGRAGPSPAAPLLAGRRPARAHRVLAAWLSFSGPLLPAECPRWRQEAARTGECPVPRGSGALSGWRAAAVTEAVGWVRGWVGTRGGRGPVLGRGTRRQAAREPVSGRAVGRSPPSSLV